MSDPTSRLDRAALRALSPEARPAALESYLVTEAAEILALRPAQLDPRRPVSAYGLDSLKAVELRFRVEEELAVSLPIESLASEVTLAGLAEQLLAELHLDDEGAPADVTAPPPSAFVPVPLPVAPSGLVPALAPVAAPAPVPEPVVAPVSSARMDFSLFYFSTYSPVSGPDKSRLVVEGAKFADRRGFAAVWTPERHFHAFGGLFPNPAVLAAALAMVTERVRLRAGSVVLPLHDPIRVVEEWAVVDNLSGGRVDLAFAAGRNLQDFALAPDAYGVRGARTLDALAEVRRLWRGEAAERRDGLGQPCAVRVHPRPLQAEPGLWLTSAGPVDVFVAAGAAGVNVLTGLLVHSVEELAAKIALYRRARADHGHDAAAGRVTVMLHTYLDEDVRRVRDKVRGPFTAYLRAFVDLWASRDERLRFGTMSERAQRDLVEFAFERYFQRSALFGTPDQAFAFASRLEAIGVTEIASLVDFGLDDASVMAGLERLAAVKDRFAAGR